MKSSRKISILVLLVSGCFLSSWTDTQIKDEVSVSTAENPPITRRSRVVKRYRAKGEVYRINVEVNNNPSWQNGNIEILFETAEGQSKPTTNPIILKPIKSKGKNGKDIEFESEEFEFSGETAKQTYNFVLVLFNNDGKPIAKFKYAVSFGESIKGTEEVDAKKLD